MSVRPLEALQQYLRRMRDRTALSQDAALLQRVVASKDREAFELLITRHGPMVLGTARRLVDNPHDAEDVFQAVFLSLARLANTIRQAATLPAWLHKATCRVAAKLRKSRLTLSAETAPIPCNTVDPAANLVWQEVRQTLDEELQQLPERLRSPLLLCYLTGMTRDEAAQQLGWSLGTLKRRLEEGRNALRGRLERRGITAVGLALSVLAPEMLQAQVNRALIDSTLTFLFSTDAVIPTTIASLVLSSTGAMKGVAMKPLLVLFAVIALGVGLYAGAGRTDPPRKAEPMEEVKPVKEPATASEDPLPTGSVLRFGTFRFRHGIPIATMGISGDEKLAVVATDGHMLGTTRVFDLTTGQALYTLPGVAQVVVGAISPDGQTLVTKHDFKLYFRNARTGKELRTIDLPRADSWSENGLLTFTPDGKAIATTSQGKVLHLFDFETGKLIRDFPHDNPESIHTSGFTQVLGVAFSKDGKRMATGGYHNDKGNYFARLWDVDTGKELRRFTHGKVGYGIRALAFSPDEKLLATGADESVLRLFEVESGKETRAFPKDGTRKIRSVAFAPDGKTVVAAGESIRLYDVASGEERLRINHSAVGLRFTDGGKTLTGAVNGAIYRWDAGTGKPLTPEGGESIVEQILVTADGKRVVTRGQNGDAHIWDASNGKHLRALKATWQQDLAMSPDGRFLIWAIDDSSVQYKRPEEPGSIYNGSRLRLYDVAADKFVDRFPAFQGNGDFLLVTDEGKKLITVDRLHGMVRLWNTESGKEESSFQAVPEAEKGQAYHVWRAALAPDGKTIAVAYDPVRSGGRERLGFRSAPHLIRLWDVPSGKMKHTLSGHQRYVLDMAFSPDGRLLATTSGEKATFVWDVATGSKAAALPEGLPAGASAMAFSHDGRFLATAIPAGTIQVWETATGTQWAEFSGHRDRPTCLAFTSSGQLLSGSVDTTVLAWNIMPTATVDAEPLEKSWDHLTKREASAAFQSVGRMLAFPKETVQLFADRIKPVEPLDPKQVKSLLTDLSSEAFGVREAASKALLNLDRRTRPYLDDALKNAKSLEVQLRVKRIIEEQDRTLFTAEQVRQIRSVMILETIGDVPAKALLTKWAEGPAGALLTIESAAALRRMEGKGRGKAS